MKKCVWNFGKVFFLYVLLLSSFPALAIVPFNISGTPESTPEAPRTLDDPDTLTQFIGELKLKAVQEWLQGQLGERYTQFERAITPDFSERYVLDYKITRTGAKREVLNLSGRLDSESLKKWIRMQDTRKGTTSLKPLFLISSNLQNFSFPSSETQQRIQDSTLASTLLNLLNPVFSKINAKPVMANGSSPLSQPARFESDINSLRDYASQMGANSAIWAHFQSCSICSGGARVDLLFYAFPGQRIAVAESEDLNVKPNEWNNPERIKAVLAPLIAQFQSGVEASVSSGQFYAQSLHVQFEGIPNYKVFKAIDADLSQSDFSVGARPKKVAGKLAEFEVFTPLSIDEFVRRVEGSELGGMKVKAQKFDSRTVVVRIGK